MDATSATSLTGTWQGQYSYPSGQKPEFFTATLLERPGLLGGSIQETLRHGKLAGRTFYASVHGKREGTSVSFVKTYETPPRQHSVQYHGIVNADGTEIEGSWTIPGALSGRFLMIRASGLAQAALHEAAAPV